MFETNLTKTSNDNNKTKHKYTGSQVIVSTVSSYHFSYVFPRDLTCGTSTFQLAALRLVKKKEVR
jgi:hypothetical protein